MSFCLLGTEITDRFKVQQNPGEKYRFTIWSGRACELLFVRKPPCSWAISTPYVGNILMVLGKIMYYWFTLRYYHIYEQQQTLQVTLGKPEMP